MYIYIYIYIYSFKGFGLRKYILGTWTLRGSFCSSEKRSRHPGRTCKQRLGYLDRQGDLVSRLLMGITGVTIWVIGVLNLLAKSP